MDAFLRVAIEILRLVPLILIFYIPALIGAAIWKERGPGYRTKAALVFGIGFGLVVALHLMVRSTSALQVVVVIGLSMVQIAVALVLAALTVYKLAD